MNKTIKIGDKEYLVSEIEKNVKPYLPLRAGTVVHVRGWGVYFVCLSFSAINDGRTPYLLTSLQGNAVLTGKPLKPTNAYDIFEMPDGFIADKVWPNLKSYYADKS